MALDHRSLRRFETSSCKPIPRGLPSSSMKHSFRRCYGGRFRSTQYAVAFPRMSRSIVARASSARKRLISICSAVTPALPLTSLSVPDRCALTQFDKVCSTTPRLRAAAAMLWPDSTSRTASCLNSSVYLPRFPFLTLRLPSLLHPFAKGLRFARARSFVLRLVSSFCTVFGGKWTQFGPKYQTDLPEALKPAQ